jgi:hypothetical protein
MAVTLEVWIDLISDTERTRRETEAQLSDAEATVTTLTQRLHELREEEKSFRSAMARRFPEAAQHIDEPSAQIAERPGVVESWASMPRTKAVERAIKELHATLPTVGPGDIEEYLKRHGRSDTRDEIGGSTARLNKVGRIHSLGRAQWVPGTGPVKTSGDVAATTPPDSVPTEWAGGDDDAAPPAAIQDHGEDPGRDARDPDRQTQ